MQVREKLGYAMAMAVAAGAFVPASASAMEFDLRGSLGQAGFTHYVSPVSNPLFNETPYITTELRPMWLHQEVPGGFATQGDDIDVFAVQIRVAITDRLGFIATKDGYADVDFDAVLPSDDGAANLAFGLKYAALAMPETNTLVTAGIKYEAPSGDLDMGGISLQGHGDGFVNLFVSGARTFDKLGVEANLGTQIACDMDDDTSFVHYSVHVDYNVLDRVFPLIELNGFSPIEDGNRTNLGVNGIDLVNLGASNADTVFTFAPGIRAKLHENVDIGFSYEIPLTDNKDIMDWRVITDFVVHL